MTNMRWVTIKPPKMFTEASVTAMNPMSLEKSISLGPAASNAPTIITDEIALVTAIRGECSAGVTLQTT